MAIRKSGNLLDVKQTAEYLGIHEQTLYDLVERKKISHIRVGKSIRFNLNEVINHHRVQPTKVLDYQPSIVKMCDGTKEASMMRKEHLGKPQTGRWKIQSGTIFSKPTKKGVIRYIGICYDAEGKINEGVLKHARNFDEACVELNARHENFFRKKHNIPQREKRITLGQFVKENKINFRMRQEMLKFFGEKWLDEITELGVLAYVRKREEAGAKNNTINNELIVLQKTLNLAKRGRYKTDDLIKWGNCKKAQEFRERVLSVEEQDKLIPELAEHLRPIVICALNTGMRRGEILSLKWRNIVNNEIIIEAQNTKTKKQRRIPINRTLGQVLEILKSRNGFSEFVFVYGEREIKDVQNGFSKACKRAGIEDFHFHDLRHTFASRLSEGGLRIESIQTVLGHSSILTTMRYINYQPVTELREAVESLDRQTPELRDISGMEESTQPLLPLISPVVS